MQRSDAATYDAHVHLQEMSLHKRKRRPFCRRSVSSVVKENEMEVGENDSVFLFPFVKVCYFGLDQQIDGGEGEWRPVAASQPAPQTIE